MRVVWITAVFIAASQPSLAHAASTGEPGSDDSRVNNDRKLQVLLEGEVVINGVLELLTTEARDACGSKCVVALFAAFNTTDDVGCICPGATSSSRRLVEESPQASVRTVRAWPKSPDQTRPVSLWRRRLRGLTELDESVGAAFSVRISGGLDGGASALERLSTNGWREVASTFGVQKSELEFSTLTVTPPSSDNETLAVIADNYDASDVAVLGAKSGVSYVGKAKGLGLFLSLLVLWAWTLLCGTACMCVALARHKPTGGDRSEKLPAVRKGATLTAEPLQPPPPREMVSPQGSLPLVEKTKFSSREMLLTSAVPASAPYAEGDAAAGGSSGRNLIPVAGSINSSSGLPASMTSPPTRADKAGGSGDLRELQLHKPYMAPLSRSQGTRDFTEQESVTPNAVTPSRLKGIGNFLGNATPSRLRRLAGRMPVLSPALSGASSRRSKRSSSRSSSRSRKSRGSHRRQGTFPGNYSQRNSSEIDHQRPPADPVYTFMIKTIAGKGFKFMSTTEIAFCAMRMYSHFKRTEGNYKRLALMKNAENVSPVYEIIWLCDANYKLLCQGQSRFFSSGKGTDAEQEKSLLACLLALSWDGSISSRHTLQRALSPAKPSKVPTPEDMFWDDFKECTDALSGDDQMVVLARVILLIADSANMVPESPLLGAGKAADEGGPSASARQKNGVEYVDIMKALSGTHLRDVGISLKTARTGWQEAHVQLVSVLLVISFLEEGAKNTAPGGERTDPLSSLEWVGILPAEALDRFLVEKLEARKALVDLDLEPSGLKITHDEEGEVERVEPAHVEKTTTSFGSGSWRGSRGHQRILPRSSDRKSSRNRRNRRRDQSSESQESKKSHSPVVITTINRNKSGVGDRDRAEGASGASSKQHRRGTPSDGASATATGGGDGKGIRTIAQQRGASSQRLGTPVVVGTPKSNATSAPNPAFSGERGGGSGVSERAELPNLTITTVDLPDRRRGSEGTRSSAGVESGGRDDFSMRNEGVHISPSAGSVDQRSETSSVVTRVYAPSSCTEDQVAFSRAGTSWTAEHSPLGSGLSMTSPNDLGMSQVSVAGSRMASPQPGTLADMQRISERSAITDFSQGTAAASRFGGGGGVAMGRDAFRSVYTIVHEPETNFGAQTSAANNSAGPSQDFMSTVVLSPQHSPSNFSTAAESDTAFSEAASRFDPPPRYHSLSAQQPVRAGGRLGIDPFSPNSAAGSRFDGSPSSHATSMSRVAGGGSPTRAAEGRDLGPMTGRSMASSMRSTGSSFFQPSSASNRSGDSRAVASSAASISSWDEEDLHNMGTRWLSERAYNQQFDAHNHK